MTKGKEGRTKQISMVLDKTQSTILPAFGGQNMKKKILHKLISQSTWTNMSGVLMQWYFTA